MKMQTFFLLFLLPLISYSQQNWNEKISPSLLEETGKFPFLIKIKGQADLSEATHFRYKEEKGAYTVEALRVHAANTQAELIQIIETRELGYQSFYIVNGIWVYGDRDDLETLAKQSSVSYIYPDEHFVVERVLDATLTGSSRTTEWGLNKIQAPAAWALGHTGQGVVVGGQDTGYEWDHIAIKNKYRGWNGTTADHDYNWHDAIHAIDSHNSGVNPCGLDSTIPCDDHNHGTHTMGTMIGDDGAGKQIGVAPDAEWMACRNMERGWGTLSTYIECFEWFIAPYPVSGTPTGGLASKAPHVINNSWECPTSEGCNSANWAMMETALDNLRTAGVVVVVSAGNSGSSCGTVNAPAAIFDGSFSIGASNSTDVIAGFSSRGPVTVDGSNRRKPDVVAPGVGVTSSIRGGAYATYNGTSMAGPHVVGAVALMIDAVPGLAGDVETIESLLESTATPLYSIQNCGGDTGASLPNHTYGYGRIDVLAAIAAAKALPVEMLSFSAENLNKDIRLNWETTQELDNNYFAIEYSSDGRYFTQIGKINASSASSHPLAYSFVHEKPNGNKHYYRLRQTDFDGSSAWYGPIFIKTNDTSIQISPNPVKDEIKISNVNGLVHLSVYDMMGRRILEKTIIALNEEVLIDLSLLNTGLYLITLENENNWTSKKIMKVDGI